MKKSTLHFLKLLSLTLILVLATPIILADDVHDVRDDHDDVHDVRDDHDDVHDVRDDNNDG